MGRDSIPKGQLIAVEGGQGHYVGAAARFLLRYSKVEAGISAWDASSIFYEMRRGNPGNSGLSPRVLVLLYAADLAFRLRWDIRPALEEGRCDIVIGVPEGYDLVRTTKPYYRSTYVFVYPKDKGPQIKSLDDPVLKKVKIGVHLLGDDYTNPPPVHELSKRGVVGNLVGFSTFYSADNPPSSIIDAVASGKIDVAIVWGPAAGYFVKQQRVPLVMVPIPSGKGDLPFEFGMSMGVKPGNDALRLKLEKVIDSRHAEITKILNDYNVPLIERKAGAKR